MNQQSAPLAGNNTERWQSLDSAHHLHPFTNPKELKENSARIIESAQGIYITDSDGRVPGCNGGSMVREHGLRSTGIN